MAVPLKHPLRLLESMRHTLLSARKRVLSALCIESCKLVGGDVAQAIPTACATEMLIAMTMIHDDLPCLDNADFRRGKPVNHKAFDEATALLAGDALFGLAFEHVASQTQNVSPERIVRVMLELSKATGPEGVQGGQMMGKLSEGRQDMSLSELKYIHTRKTARLIMSAVLGGAIVGGGTDDEVERLGRFGEKTGFLFQVLDDIVDATKTTEELGKDAGTDAARDILTYPKFMGIQGAKNYASQLLDDCLQELSYFDAERAAPLKNIVRFVYSLQN